MSANDDTHEKRGHTFIGPFEHYAVVLICTSTKQELDAAIKRIAVERHEVLDEWSMRDCDEEAIFLEYAFLAHKERMK